MFKYDQDERAWIDKETGERIEWGESHYQQETDTITLIASDGTMLGGLEFNSHSFNDNPQHDGATRAIHIIVRAWKFESGLIQRHVEFKRGSDPITDRLIGYLMNDLHARFPYIKVEVVDGRIPGSI